MVWQEARELAVEIYRITDLEPFNRDYSFRDQIRRAAISIPSNIAEGDESGFIKLSIRYFHNAKASLSELETQIEIAMKTNFIKKTDSDTIDTAMDQLSRKLRRLIQLRQSL